MNINYTTMNRKTCLKVKVDFEAPSKALRIYDKMREIKKINNRKEKKKNYSLLF